jgi:hypothetical protein
MGEVLAIGEYADNADLMVACRELGYLSDEMLIVDPTFGLGRFWKRWMPSNLWGSDLNGSKSPFGRSVDACVLPFEDAWVDAVVLDPPYKLNGRASAGGPATSDESYGVDGDYVPWQERHRLICGMVTEASRVVRDGGIVLLKCQDQVCSGRMRWQTIEFAEHAESNCGLRLIDSLMLVGHRKQPAGRQVHARRNYSTLLVFRKGDGSWRRSQ